MSKRTLTTAERDERVARRATLREAAAAKIESLREWRDARSAIALKRERERVAELNELPRGIDRVPAHLTDGNPLQRRPRPTQIDAADVTVQYGDQRPSRFPSKRPRPRRRRDLPGATARRLERNRKAWIA